MTAPASAPPIERIAEEIVYRNRFVTVFDDHVRFSSGRQGRYYRIISGSGHPGVVVMPVTGEHTALVRTWRYATQEWEWGFPRGYAHGPCPETTARAELIEEIGAAALDLVFLGCVHPDSAHLGTAVHMYAARVGAAAMQAVPADTEEITEIRWLTFSGLTAMIAAGEITDGFTLSAVSAWNARQVPLAGAS